MLRRHTGPPSPPSVSRAAAILLLAVSVATSGVQLDTLFFTSSSSSSAECDYDGSYNTNSSAASGSGSGWLYNLTGNFTELCSGMIDANSSDPIYSYPRNSTDGNYTSSLCSNNLYTLNHTFCRYHDMVTLHTETLTYVDAQSTIVATINPNATGDTQGKLYYQLCYRLVDTWEDKSELVDCVSNGTTMKSEYRWKASGEALLTVHVYTSPNFSDSTYLSCGFAKVTVASNSDLNLTVDLVNKPAYAEEGTRFYEGGALECNLESSVEDGREEGVAEEDEEGEGETEKPPLVTGNVTFLSFANLTFDNVEEPVFYYKYIIQGPFSDAMATCVRQPNWTGEYMEMGTYNYTIHAIAVLNPDLAFHAVISGRFEMFEGVRDAIMQVGNNNSVKVGSREDLTITAEGSTPIEVCWTDGKVESKSKAKDSRSGGPVDPPPVPPLPPPPPRPSRDYRRWGSRWVISECVTLNGSSSWSGNRYFNEVGTFQYSAFFCNKASQIQRNFTYKVISGPSPAVVASSATAVVVAAVLVTISVIVVILIVGGYIPYRRYKNRMTETADFRFVDLSEKRTRWDRVKLKTNQFMDYFKNRRKNEKIGLVNMGSMPTTSEERRLFYGSNTLTQFAPYETI